MLIGEHWKIESDDLNVIVSRRTVARKGKNDGKEKWTAEAFCSSLQNALQWLVDQEVKETGLTDLRTVLKKQTALYKLMKDIKLGAPVGERETDEQNC